jgi:nitroreductase
MSVCVTGALVHADMAADSFESLPGVLPAPEQIDSLLKSRRSIRSFKDKPADRETILSCLNIARRAPTAKNSQRLHWIVVEGKEKVRELSLEAINGLDASSVQPGLLQRWNEGYDFILRRAPSVVVVCAPTEYAWGKEDASIALTYFEMAAKARGVGVCWAGYLTVVAQRHAPLRRLLRVPDGYSVRGAMMVGQSKYTYRRVPPRKPLSVQWN